MGSHLVQKLVQSGHRVHCLVRENSNTEALQKLRVETMPGDILEPESLRGILNGVDCVIHLVGIIYERAHASFESVHYWGAKNVMDAAKDQGVPRFIHMSALGSSPGAKSQYHRTKWKAEEYLRGSGLRFTIFRPSVIFGPRDGFVNQVADVVRKAPLIPIPGRGEFQLQPVSVHDVTDCFTQAVTKDSTIGQAYELGGPQQLAYPDIVDLIADRLGVRKRKFFIPFDLMYPAAWFAQTFLSPPPLTLDQLKMMKAGSVCDTTDMTVAFDVKMITLREGLKEYL